MKQSSRLFSGVISLIIIVGSVYGITHRQEIYDWFRLRNYNPPQRIVLLADSTTMQPQTRKIFYVNHPELSDKAEFRRNCPTTEQSIVLGCFVSTRGIFVLDIDDPRLNGIIEVTAAHEVLHAAYDRLSSSERQRVDTMTSNFFNGMRNERIQKTVEQYRAKDASIVPNELHSILATEVRDLSPELETYYGKHFSNRKVLVEFSEKYEQTFVDLQNQVEQYDRRLNRLKSTIEANQNELTEQNSAIESERRRLDDLSQARRTEEYNASIPGFNRLVNEYNNLIATTKDLIEQHNALVEKRNTLVTTEQELIQAIDSNIAPRQQSE